MRNKKRYLSKEREEVYKKYRESRGEEFKKSIDRKYRISDEEYKAIFQTNDGYLIRGKSTLYDSEGNVKLEWVKTSIDDDKRRELIQSIKDGLNSEIKKQEPIKWQFSDLRKEIINQYTITDYHLGMMAWGKETGDDWSLDIAEKLIIDWFEYAISISPNSEKCIFAQLGDFLHWDGLEAVTPSSKHILDADTRFTKLVRSSIRVLRKITLMLLSKHKEVHIILAEGNHDMASSVWLKESFNFFYEDEPRVTIDTSPDPYYAYSFGDVLLFYNHGHLKKFGSLDSVFASKFKQLFGKSNHVYAHTGHLHNDHIIETNLMKLEQHRTLTAKDSYASRHGFMSGRDAKVITYHVKHGETARLTINPDIINKS